MKKTRYMLLSSMITTIIFFSVFFMIDYTKKPSTIFNKTIYSIVEVKSYTNDIESYGTAVVIDREGNLITNYHVISYSINNVDYLYENVSIRLATEDEYIDAYVVSYDCDKDLAIINVSDNETRNKIKAITFGDSSKIVAGDICYAIGNSGNLMISISKGIVSSSSVKLSIEGNWQTYIQSDNSIMNGSSGGALLDSYGRLIGIINLRLKDNTGAIIYGYCYSIPLSVVKKFILSETTN